MRQDSWTELPYPDGNIFEFTMAAKYGCFADNFAGFIQSVATRAPAEHAEHAEVQSQMPTPVVTPFAFRRSEPERMLVLVVV